MKKYKKVVLAYSGGLDTSVIIHWLKEHYGCKVIALFADLGQEKNLTRIRQRAKKSGADKIYIQDLKGEFLRDYAFRVLKAGAVYEGGYVLSAALSRPLIARELVKIAYREKAAAVAHGCTGKGNDQVRFEVSVKAIAPELKIIAPVREWELKTRQEEMIYARKHSIPLEKEAGYSIDRNLWGTSIECGILEDPTRESPEEIYRLTVSPEKSPQRTVYLSLIFEKGSPVGLNGRRYKPVELMQRLNKIGGAYGIGRTDLVENRLVGIKSREIYEAPGATILRRAHQGIEELVLDRETSHYKSLVAQKYAELIYYGLWESPLREALDAFIDKTQEKVTGKIKMKLYKGNCRVAGRESPYSLYNRKLATYGKADEFDRTAAKGFIELWGLPLKIKSKIKN